MKFSATKIALTLFTVVILGLIFFTVSGRGATTINVTLKTNPDLERGLVGHWTFDGEDLIENAADRSGQGNTGYLEGFTSTTTAPGRIGQALEFENDDAPGVRLRSRAR